MRSDSAAFALQNLAASKEPRYTIEIAFDPANTDLWYFTSHSDGETANPSVTTYGVVEGLSGTSQRITPQKGIATIGNLSFSLVDKSSAVRDLQNTKLVLGKSLRRMRVRVYVGFDGLSWSDYSLVQTQIIDDVQYEDGAYTFKCSDIQREARKDIFDVAETNITATVSDSDTTINVLSTSDFTLVAHGASYTDAPSATVGYVKIDDEVIRYTGKTATSFTGCTRGALNTKAAVHSYDAATASDRQPKAVEYVYLEMPAPKLMIAILTGVLNGQGVATLPDSWHLGIDSQYVRESDFTGIGDDWYDTTDDTKGLRVRFSGLKKQDGKKFIEQELALLLGAYMPVYASGELGLKRMTSILAGAAYVAHLTPDNVISHSALLHDMGEVRNDLEIQWNWDDVKDRYTRRNVLLDSESIAIHGQAEQLKLQFRGLHGSIHTTTHLARRFDSLRDRFSGPPLAMTVEVLPSLNTVEVGDIVRVELPNMHDFVAGDAIDRSFEVQSVRHNWITGNVSLSLFASSAAAGTISHTTASVVVDDAYYTAQGTELSTVLTISADTVTANGNLPDGDYYYDGDLTIGSGVTVTINGTVRLFIKGFFQVDGTLDGSGRGLTGATAPAAANHAHTLGTSGYLGHPISGGGFYFSTGSPGTSTGGYITSGKYDSVPVYDIVYDGSAVNGLPDDLEGTSGSSGRVTYINGNVAIAGDGGDSGAGLVVVCRGMAFGASGAINTSGGDGSVGGSVQFLAPFFYSGSGAGGSPGAIAIFLDGDSALFPSIGAGNIVAKYGDTPIAGDERFTTPGWPSYLVPDLTRYYSYYVGTGDGSLFPVPDMSGIGQAVRIQYILDESTPAEDTDSGKITAPSGLTLLSGDAYLLLNGDGSIIPRIQATWTPSTDPRTVGYEFEFKKTADSDWLPAPPVLGINSNLTYISPVQDGVSYDVRIRAADAFRQSSDWVTVTGHTVTGKIAPPNDVSGFIVRQTGDVVIFDWDDNTDSDLAGYEIRYGQPGIAYADATPLVKALRGTSYLTTAMPTGTWSVLIKAIDTSGNYSTNAASQSITVTSVYDIFYQEQQAPDWLGEIDSTGDTLLDETGSDILTESAEEIHDESAVESFVRHWSGVLIPNSTDSDSTGNNLDVFEEAVLNPVSEAVYTAQEIDGGFDSEVRLFGNIDSALLPGETGLANPKLWVDYRTEAGAYDGYEQWGIGEVTCRYAKHRLKLDTSVGLAYVSGFLPTVDLLEETVRNEDVTISAGGSVVAHPRVFHLVPFVKAWVNGDAARYVTRNGVTVSQAEYHVFDDTGSDVGGVIDIEITGV